MSNPLRLAILFIILVPLGRSHALRAQEWTEGQLEVWASVQELWHLSGALDFDPWFARVSEDYRGWSVADEAPRGKMGWWEEAQERLTRPRRVHHQIVPKAIDIYGDMAIVFYLYSMLTKSDDGAYSLSNGQWTDVFRREGGSWALIADAGGETGSHPDILVSGEWLQHRLYDPDFVVLQVESQDEKFAEGRIPGSLPLPYQRIVWDGPNGEGAELVPLEELAGTLENLGLDDDDQVVVYSSSPLRATRLWFTLDMMGVGRTISLLDGGLPAWQEEGRPLTTEAPEPPPLGTLTLRPRPGVVVDAEWVMENHDNPSVAILDVRSDSEYTGEGQEAERVGHLPGAGNASWEDMIESREVFRFRPLADMAQLLIGAGASPGEAVVPYCVVGVRASFAYFVARLLGYETFLYDGSWRDWTNRGLPLVEGGG